MAKRVRADIDTMIQNDDLAGLLRSTAQLHGHYCGGSALGVIAAHCAMKRMGAVSNLGMEDLIAVVETNNCFADGVQMVTGCSLGNNALVYRDYGKTAFSLVDRHGNGIRISVRPDAFNLLKDKNPEAQKLYLKIVNKRKATPKEEERIMLLNQRHCFEILEIPAERLFKIEEVSLKIPGYSRILDSRICGICGERVMKVKASRQGDLHLCRACGRSAYGQLDWAGIHSIRKSQKK